jgi:hypothetical protein
VGHPWNLPFLHGILFMYTSFLTFSGPRLLHNLEWMNVNIEKSQSDAAADAVIENTRMARFWITGNLCHLLSTTATPSLTCQSSGSGIQYNAIIY